MQALMGANHIVQRLYMRNASTAEQLGGFGAPQTAAEALLQQRLYELDMLPGIVRGQKRRAEESLGSGDAKRVRVDIDHDWMDRAGIFDTADTIYAMEYLRNSNVRISLRSLQNDTVSPKRSTDI